MATSFSFASFYYFQVELIRQDHQSFFVSLSSPHVSVTSQTLSRRVRVVFGLAGIDSAAFQPHSCRAAAAAHMRSVRKLSCLELCRRADWSMASGNYKKFYERYV